MKKISKFIPALIAGFTMLFASCDIFGDLAQEIIGDPVGETCFLNCGITKNMTISGTIASTHSDYIELKPLEKMFYAYNKENGEKKYTFKGHFFYQENLGNPDQGEFWVEVLFLWNNKKNDWDTPNKSFNEMAHNENHFKASGVDLVTSREADINATELKSQKEYDEAYDALSKYVIEKHAGSDDPSGITKESLIEEITAERYQYLENFESALASHDTSKTKVSYEKKDGIYTYFASIDDSKLELMIFSGTGDLFFYPINGETEHDYMMGMYAYNRSKRNQRRWIRENFTNIGSLYDELKSLAAEAKAKVNTSN
ncbi:MAG: hypothetical protein K6E78_07065 [Treponema sp.]|nr:hypothetical protein [Treponema sp.]